MFFLPLELAREPVLLLLLDLAADLVFFLPLELAREPVLLLLLDLAVDLVFFLPRAFVVEARVLLERVVAAIEDDSLLRSLKLLDAFVSASPSLAAQT